MAAREYQVKQIDQAIESASKYEKIIVQLPTGGGKTYEFALLTQRYTRNTDKSVLILVDRIELMNQAKDAIFEITGITPRLINSKTKQFQVGRVYIAMIESLMSRMDLFQNVGLIIIDEAHVANFQKAHSLFLEHIIIGYTATPIAASIKNPLNRYYHNIVVGPQISELIADGFLSRNITRCPKSRVDASKFVVDKLTGDYNEGQMFAEYKAPKNITNVVKQYETYCEGQKTIVFNVNKEHSKKVNQAFVLCGYNSRHLDSDASEAEREETLKWFHDTEDAILNNVGLFTRGFDEPSIRNVIVNFSTTSVPKWLQCTGRGSRIMDKAFIAKYQEEYPYKLNEKNTFQIIDLGGNAVNSAIGDWSDDRDWEYVFNHPEIPGDGVAPTKICPQCEGLVHAALRVCNLTLPDGSDCLYEFEKKKIKEEQDQEMVVITKGVNVENYVEKYANKYDYYVFMKMGEDIVKNVFSSHYNPTQAVLERAFKHYYDLCIKWHKEHMAGKNGELEDISNSAWHLRKARKNFDDLVKKHNDGAIPYDYTSMYINNDTENYAQHLRRVVYL